MTPYLRTHFADLVQGIPALDDWIAARVDEALHWDVKDEPVVAPAIRCSLRVALQRYGDVHDAWIASVMEDRYLLAVGKVRKLVAQAREHGLIDVDRVDFTNTLEGV